MACSWCVFKATPQNSDDLSVSNEVTRGKKVVATEVQLSVCIYVYEKSGAQFQYKAAGSEMPQ